MNATKSVILWILIAAVFAAGIWGFAHGAEMTATGPKAAWMVGSVAVMIITVFLSYSKLLKKK